MSESWLCEFLLHLFRLVNAGLRNSPLQYMLAFLLFKQNNCSNAAAVAKVLDSIKKF